MVQSCGYRLHSDLITDIILMRHILFTVEKQFDITFWGGGLLFSVIIWKKLLVYFMGEKYHLLEKLSFHNKFVLISIKYDADDF